MIKPHSTAVLLGGTTVFRICKHIKNIPITVITNSMIVFNELVDKEHIQLILLGGEYNRDEAELRGFLTLAGSKLMTCDYLFMGADGYVQNVGCTTADLEAMELYNWCMALSQSTIVLMDSTKFGKRGKAVIAAIKNIDIIITDNGISPEALRQMEENAVEVIIVE